MHLIYAKQKNIKQNKKQGSKEATETTPRERKKQQFYLCFLYAHNICFLEGKRNQYFFLIFVNYIKSQCPFLFFYELLQIISQILKYDRLNTMQKVAFCTCNTQTLSLRLTAYAMRICSRCDAL